MVDTYRNTLSWSFKKHGQAHNCNSKDKNTLLQIKKHFNNTEFLSSWDPQTDCCTSWTGIECTNGRVTLFSMANYRTLYGQIPDQIGDLLELRTLEMSHMKLTGNIPRTITKLKHLVFIFLLWNKLSGPIPDYISELKSVTFLDISFNKFTGPIPGWLTQMPKLQTFQADNNSLTGPVPNSFGSFVGSVPNLFLKNNKLSGKIPESLSKMDFQAVVLKGNGFTGDGSMFFGGNKRTVQVDLSRNLFEFDLSKIKFGKSLAMLDLSHNRIFGTLPRELTQLHLERFNISYNRLCGKIPRGGQLQTFKSYEFAENRCLCGSPLKKAC
ncbi:BnaC05g40900D [Brassica napus]|uniref:BnaC05g40900D protein n=1 Tax=Brassica napus TaxID=3708 RepID=A0A078HXR6_BRANA|nr:BnaC05g40900D [Brassica napus]